jgi:hypothetical protein
MQLEANQISRDWTILHDGRNFYVNYTESDGHPAGSAYIYWRVATKMQRFIYEYVFTTENGTP